MSIYQYTEQIWYLSTNKSKKETLIAITAIIVYKYINSTIYSGVEAQNEQQEGV